MRFGTSKHAVSRAFAILIVMGLVTGAARAELLLAVDVSDRSAADGSTTDSGTQPGFGLYLMGASLGNGTLTDTNGVTQVVNGYSVNLAPLGVYPPPGGPGYLDDRDRNFTLPGGATPPYLEIYDDFVFNGANSGGLRLTVKGSGQQGGGTLEPNTQYLVSIYAYDHSSGTTTRTANYVDKNNSDAYVLTTSFIGGTVPATPEANKFTGLAMTDSQGVLLLAGINTTSLSPTTGLPGTLGVFINGFEISTAPEPSAAGLIGLAALLMSRRRKGPIPRC